MHKQLRSWIVRVLEEHEALLRIAVRQRAKFEGWLKLELAAYIETIGGEQVRLEAPLGTRKDSRCDLSFSFAGIRYNVEIKTPNTNWRLEGVEDKHRPITQNIKGITRDVTKLQKTSDHGLMAFVLFPVPCGDSRWERYLKRIEEATGERINVEDTCSRVRLELNRHEEVELVVCCFPVHRRTSR